MSLEERLTLPDADDEGPDLDEMRARLEAGSPEAGDSPSKDRDPRLERVYAFDFNKKVGRKNYRGKFTSTILSGHQRRLSAQMTSDLLGGRPLESIPQRARQEALILSHLTFALTERPSWAANLAAIEDERVLVALYEEVHGHLAMFRDGEDGPQQEAPAAGE